MQILGVKLSQIRSYSESKVVFPQGRILLSGDIGSGKSTLLYAIEFALFGIQRGEIAGTSLLKHGANDGSVELACLVHGKQVKILRTLKRSSNGVKQGPGSLEIDGGEITGTPSEIDAHVKELLGYPSESGRSAPLLFRFTVYTPQEAMKRILFESQEERMNTIRILFGVEKYKNVKQNAAVILRSLRSSVREITPMLKDMDVIQSEKKEHEQLLVSAKQQVADKEKNLAQAKASLDAVVEEQKQMESKFLEYQELKKNQAIAVETQSQLKDDIKQILDTMQRTRIAIESCKVQIGDADPEKEWGVIVSSIGQIQDLQTQIQEDASKVQQQKSALDTTCNDILNSCAQIHSFLELMDSDSEAPEEKELLDSELLRDEITSAEQKLAEMQDARMNLTQKQSKLDERISRENRTAENLTELNECPTCLQSIDESHKDHVRQLAEVNVKKYGELKIKVDKNLQAATNNVSILEKKLVQLREQLVIAKKQKDDLEHEKIKLQRQQEQLDRNYVALRKIGRHCVEVCDQSETMLGKFGVTSIRSDLEKIHSDIVSTFSGIGIQTNNLAIKREELDQLRAEESSFQEIGDKIREIASRLKIQAKPLTGLSADVDQVTIATLRSQFSTIAKLQSTISQLREENASLLAKRNSILDLIGAINRGTDDALQSRQSQLNAKISSKKQLDALQEQLKAGESQHQAKLDQLSSVEKNVEKFTQSLGNFEDIAKATADIKSRLEISRSEHQELTVIVERAKHEVNSHEKEIVNLQKRESKLKEVSDRKKRLTNTSTWLDDAFLQAVSEVESKVLAAARRDFSLWFVSIFDQLIEDDGISVSLNENFAPIVQMNGYEAEVSDLSGGEKTAVALAYRLALNKVINTMMEGMSTSDLLILDEPTDGFSSEQLDRVGRILTDLDVDQLILVSHEPKMESLVNHVMRVEKRHFESVVSNLAH